MKIGSQISLFYSYAQVDATLRDELEKHLSLLRQGGFIAQWYDRDISAGTDWADQIDKHLKAAHIILLLISSDYLASTYCYSIEMKNALERHEVGEARVIPILLRPVDWQDAPFAKLEVLPQNKKPITTWANRDLAFEDIAIQIRKVASELIDLKKLTKGSDLQKPLKSLEEGLMGGVEGAKENLQHEQVYSPNSQAVKQFRHCQKKVEELKSIHNMLHEIEVQLTGLAATVQLIAQEAREKKNVFFNWFLIKKDNGFSSSALGYIEIIWRQAVLKIDDLEYFAAEAMKTLEEEHFYFDNNAVRGPLWVTELFFLQQSFEVSIKDNNVNAVRKIAAELLAKCRIHLYRIDKRLLDAVKDLELASDNLLRYIA